MSISSEINRISTAKSSLADAIESKGVNVPDGTTLDGYPNLVRAIEHGADDWSGLNGKPFESLGDDFSVDEDGVLSISEDADVYHEWRLAFDGTKITKDGAEQTFSQIVSAIDDNSKFVYLVFQNRLYIPQYRDTALVSFSCSYLDGTTPTIRRVRMTSAGAITTATETNYTKTEMDIKLSGKSGKANSFTVTLAAAWTDNQQTVSNALFKASGFAYTVAPVSTSYSAYADAGIYADDVTTDGVMVFHCGDVPSETISVNILRNEVA